MTALAQDYNQPLTEGADIFAHTVMGTSTVYAGTLAMNDAGVVKPYTAAGYAGGATLLGFPTTRLTNDTGSNITYSANKSPLKFRRNCPFVCQGASIAASYIGKTVYLQDNFTISTTDSGTDQGVILMQVLSATHVVVKLPA